MLDYVWSDFFDCVGGFGVDWIFVVDWIVQCVDYVIQQFWIDWNFQDVFGVFGVYVFGEVLVFIQDYGIYGILFQVQCYIVDVVWEFDYFVVYDVGQIVDVYDIVGYVDDGVFVLCLGGDVEFFDVFFDDFINFGRIELLYVVVFLNLRF